MSEPVDHVAEARRLLEASSTQGGAEAVATATEAQAHATLALVQQQRAANAIAYLGLKMQGVGAGTHLAAGWAREFTKYAPLIHEAIRVSDLHI